MTKKILPKKFFNRGTLVVARELLGKYLVVKMRGKERALMINEVEAYDGFKDKASHAHRGETPRNKVMFGESGIWYIYLTYGMHYMLNIVTGPKKYPAAVLIRGAGEIFGPGKLTKKLRINKNFNQKRATKKTGLWIEDRGIVVLQKNIKNTPRIGVEYSGPIWSKKHYRFLIK